MSFDPLPAAALLLRSRRARELLAPLPPGVAPTTEAEGAAVQAALARAVGAFPPAGFKIGATGARMQEYLGVDHPIAGFMRAADIYRATASLRFADLVRPGVECEIAVRLGRDLPPGPCSAEQVVENRYGDIKQLGTPCLVADQMYHAAAVVGDAPAGGWRSLGAGALRGRISIDGAARDQGTSADLMGHPINCLAWLAGSPVVAAFGGLKAGQTVMLGSVTPPVWLDGPAAVEVAFDGLPPVRVVLG
jgi:2-keto-4-pentenoate hydratase